MAADTVMAPAHPGEILLEEFLKPLAVSQCQLAKEIGGSRRAMSVWPGCGQTSFRAFALDIAALGPGPRTWRVLATAKPRSAYVDQGVDSVRLPGMQRRDNPYTL